MTLLQGRLLPRHAVPLLLIAFALATSACGGNGAANGEAAHAEEQPDSAEKDVVRLDSAALAMADIRVGKVEVAEVTTLPVTGTITFDANLVSHIGPKTAGRLVTLRADLGQRVVPGQPLAILESAEIGSTRAELHQWEELLKIAQENYERERRLEEQGISSRKELLEAQAEMRRAQAAVSSAAERLRVLGASHGDEAGEGALFIITAPFAGVVVEKHASRGEVVGPEDRIFTVADLSRVWIELDIFERNLAQVALGQPVTVTTAAYPGRRFPARIVYVGDVIDVERRTVRARVEVNNPGGSLKPGMFTTALIDIGGGNRIIVVPRDAVQEVEGRQIVWVPGARPGEFRMQPVELGASVDDQRVQIRSGLTEGQQIVVAGAFTLKAEHSRAEFGGHGH